MISTFFGDLFTIIMYILCFNFEHFMLPVSAQCVYVRYFEDVATSQECWSALRETTKIGGSCRPLICYWWSDHNMCVYVYNHHDAVIFFSYGRSLVQIPLQLMCRKDSRVTFIIVLLVQNRSMCLANGLSRDSVSIY